MTWHQLTYESGGTVHIRWLRSVEYMHDGRLLIGTNHIGQELTLSTATPFAVKEREALPEARAQEHEQHKAGELP